MLDLFYMGGPLFMSLVTAAALLMLGLTFRQITGDESVDRLSKSSIPIAGSLALVIGLLGQTLGLYQMLSAMEQAGVDLPAAMIWGGLKITFISSGYGLIVFVLSLIIWFVLSYMQPKGTAA